MTRQRCASAGRPGPKCLLAKPLRPLDKSVRPGTSDPNALRRVPLPICSRQLLTCRWQGPKADEARSGAQGRGASKARGETAGPAAESAEANRSLGQENSCDLVNSQRRRAEIIHAFIAPRGSLAAAC